VPKRDLLRRCDRLVEVRAGRGGGDCGVERGNMKDYKTLFESIEKTLITEGSKILSIEKIRENLDWFKHLEGKKFSDNDYYQILVNVIFYSGFRAATVTEKIPVIRKYFSDYLTVTSYSEEKLPTAA
jgi:DNA-3-methyladenine glycosylase I